MLAELAAQTGEETRDKLMEVARQAALEAEGEDDPEEEAEDNGEVSPRSTEEGRVLLKDGSSPEPGRRI